jgi:SAM-dependent methyltransferase
MSNPEYTSLWTDDFTRADVQSYDSKFKSRWEKHIKHQEQVTFIRRYLQDWMYWCDAPIGSGRLMQALQTEKMLGYDISEAFLAYNRERGIPCEKGDLFDFGSRFQAEFDLITSLHSIFAFRNYKTILHGFVNSLKPGGVLIVDITNRAHSERTQAIKAKIFDDPSVYPDGMDRDEIQAFFESIGCRVLEIQPHDYWDNYYAFDWRYLQGNWVTRRIKKYAWGLLNFAYFRLGLADFLRKLEAGKPDHTFTKYLVAVRKQ